MSSWSNKPDTMSIGTLGGSFARILSTACCCQKASYAGCDESSRQNPNWSSPRDFAIAPAEPARRKASYVSRESAHQATSFPRVASWPYVYWSVPSSRIASLLNQSSPIQPSTLGAGGAAAGGAGGRGAGD